MESDFGFGERINSLWKAALADGQMDLIFAILYEDGG